MTIRGIHGLLYSTDAEASRRFFRDVVQLPGADIGDGWWIYDFPEGDLGVHPTEDQDEVGMHGVSFYCDDIQGTVAELKERGAHFTTDIQDHGYGLVTYFTAPGGISVQLYEPRYVKPRAAKKKARAKKAPTKKKAARKSAPKKKR